MHKNGYMTAESVFPLKEDPRDIEYYIELLVRMKEPIMQHKAYTTSDASMKEGKMGSYWLITDNKNQEIIQNTLFHKRWNNNIIKGVEAIVILELLIVLYKRSRNVISGKVTIGIDNPKVYKGLVNEIHKVGYFSQDTGVKIA